MSCLFCDNNEAFEELKVLTKKGLQTIINSSTNRRDGRFSSLNSKDFAKYRIHNTCRSQYTKKSNIEAAVENLSATQSTGSGVDMAWPLDASADFQFQSMCILCEKSTAKVAKK